VSFCKERQELCIALKTIRDRESFLSLGGQNPSANHYKIVGDDAAFSFVLFSLIDLISLALCKLHLPQPSLNPPIKYLI